ncbi:hypothetical protein [Pseudaestuariivita atlantica]|uniref:hypothetical protein n=1 Tax=Pseudaestuariivita atlantica TaxID=1317121 RepID=UPI00106D9AB5|nr:hypothetical protein [Pseudaestuariivita atlantica]
MIRHILVLSISFAALPSLISAQAVCEKPSIRDCPTLYQEECTNSEFVSKISNGASCGILKLGRAKDKPLCMEYVNRCEPDRLTENSPKEIGDLTCPQFQRYSIGPDSKGNDPTEVRLNVLFSQCTVSDFNIFNSAGKELAIFAVEKDLEALLPEYPEVDSSGSSVCDHTLIGFETRDSLEAAQAKLDQYIANSMSFRECRQYFGRLAECVFNLEGPSTANNAATQNARSKNWADYEIWQDNQANTQKDYEARLARITRSFNDLNSQKVFSGCF